MPNRIAVTDSYGQPGYLDEGDATGASFTPDPFVPRQQSGAERLLRTVSGTIPGPALFGQKLQQALPTSLLEPAGAITGGLLAQAALPVPFAGTLGAAGGGALGRLSALSREKPALQNTPQVRKEIGQAAVRNAAYTVGGAGIGKVAGVVGRAARGARYVFSDKAALKLAEEGQAALGQVMSKAGEQMEAGLSKLPGAVDLTDEVMALRQSMVDNPAVKRLVDEGIRKAATVKDLTLRNLLDTIEQIPQIASQLTPLQVQQVLSTLKFSRQVGGTLSRIGQPIGGRGGDFLRRTSGETLDILGHTNQIREKIVAQYPQAFPKIAGTFAKQAKGFRRLLPKFRDADTLIGKFRKGFMPAAAQTIRDVLPKQTAKRLFLPATARRVGRAAVAATGLGTAGALAYGGYKALTE